MTTDAGTVAQPDLEVFEQARERAEERGTTFAELDPWLRNDQFYKPLPNSEEDAGTIASRMLDMQMFTDAARLDQPLRIETAFGDLVCDRAALVADLKEALRGLASSSEADAGPVAAGPDPADDPGGDLLVAAGVLLSWVERVEAVWRARRVRVARAVRRTERIAAQLLVVHLTRSEALAHDARKRYLQPGTNEDTEVPLPASVVVGATAYHVPDYLSLRKACLEVREARKSLEVDSLRDDQTAMAAVGTALTVGYVWASIARGEPRLDDRAWGEIHAANRVVEDAARRHSRAMAEYLVELRRHAAHHPILMVARHQLLSGDLKIARAVEGAVRDALEAIESLRAAATSGETVPLAYEGEVPSVERLAEAIAGARPETVWKLPFFVEQALLRLPPDQALDVRGVMDHAVKVARDDSMAATMALLGVESALLVVGLAGPIGIAIASVWGVVQLIQSVRDYHSMSLLYRASIDPSVLLRGMEHDEASKLGIFFDVLGLLAWPGK